MKTLKIGTRKSALALWQAETVADRLQQRGWQTQLVTIETRGDRIVNKPIAEIGGKGVFTEEIEAMLEKGDIDLAVHSAKDMPSELPPGFSLIAFTERERVNDVLLSSNPSLSPDHFETPLRIGTSSVRRVALLKHFYPHVETVDMRGNLQTRIKKMTAGTCDALILAYAGVKRMNYTHMIVNEFPITEFVPPAGQGSLAIEVFATMDADLKASVRQCINHPQTETALTAERAFLKTLGGGCSIPVFAFAASMGSRLHLTAGLISLDGATLLKTSQSGNFENARNLGEKAGLHVLAAGGEKLLAEIKCLQAINNSA